MVRLAVEVLASLVVFGLLIVALLGMTVLLYYGWQVTA